MNRYMVIRGLYDTDAGAAIVGPIQNYFVVDLTGLSIVADCGDNSGLANKVASALNTLDGGPL